MSNGAGRVPIFACVRDAWLFLVRNWRLFVPAAAITAVVAEIGSAAMLLAGGAQVSMGAGFLMVIPAIIAGVMFQAAILRKALRDEFKPPFGVTLGADEARMIAVSLCVALVAIPIMLLLGVLLTATVLRQVVATPEAMEALASDPNAMAEALAQALGPVGFLVFMVALIVLTALALGLVELANAATIGERKIVVFQAWRWVGGNFLRVLAAIVLTVVPIMIASSIVSEILLAVLVSASSDAPNVAANLLVSLLISFVSSLIAIPITALGAVLYKGLRPADFVAK